MASIPRLIPRPALTAAHCATLLHMSKHLAFRATDVNLRQIELIQRTYAIPGHDLTAADAVRIALEVTCRQLEAEAKERAERSLNRG